MPLTLSPASILVTLILSFFTYLSSLDPLVLLRSGEEKRVCIYRCPFRFLYMFIREVFGMRIGLWESGPIKGDLVVAIFGYLSS